MLTVFIHHKHACNIGLWTLSNLQFINTVFMIIKIQMLPQIDLD